MLWSSHCDGDAIAWRTSCPAGRNRHVSIAAASTPGLFCSQAFFTPTFSFSWNVAEFPRSRNQLKLLRHQLNYVLTTCPPDVLFIAAVALRAEHRPHSARCAGRNRSLSSLLHYPFSIENTRRGGRHRGDLQHLPELLSLRLSASVRLRRAKSRRSAGTLPVPPARADRQWS